MRSTPDRKQPPPTEIILLSEGVFFMFSIFWKAFYLGADISLLVFQS